MNVQRHVVEGLPRPDGAFVHAVVHGGLVYCAGQVGNHPVTGELLGGVEAQTRQALENLSTVLRAVGSDVSNVIQARVFLRNFGDFEVMDRVFRAFFGDVLPARTTVPCSGYPEGLEIEIDLIAAVGND